MGIIIRRSDKTPATDTVPFPIAVQLECAQATAFFCRGFAVFESADGLIGARREATAAGWVERKGGWVCRECAS